MPDYEREGWDYNPMSMGNHSLTVQKKCIWCSLCVIITLLVAIFAMTFINLIALSYGVQLGRQYKDVADKVRTTNKEVRSTVKNFTKLSKDVPVLVEIADIIVKNKAQIVNLLPFISKAKQCVHEYKICPNI